MALGIGLIAVGIGILALAFYEYSIYLNYRDLEAKGLYCNPAYNMGDCAYPTIPYPIFIIGSAFVAVGGLSLFFGSRPKSQPIRA